MSKETWIPIHVGEEYVLFGNSETGDVKFKWNYQIEDEIKYGRNQKKEP